MAPPKFCAYQPVSIAFILQRFINRVWTYLVLVNDSYPSTDDHQ
jgi:hypothetical protein